MTLKPVAAARLNKSIGSANGCWMAIGVEGSKDAMVRMHGCEGMDEVGAELELDATGVELDPVS